MSRRANINALCGNQFAGFEVEGRPWSRHAAEGHFLNWKTRGAIHDGRDDTHGWPLAIDAPDCQPQPMDGNQLPTSPYGARGAINFTALSNRFNVRFGRESRHCCCGTCNLSNVAESGKSRQSDLNRRQPWRAKS